MLYLQDFKKEKTPKNERASAFEEAVGAAMSPRSGKALEGVPAMPSPRGHWGRV